MPSPSAARDASAGAWPRDFEHGMIKQLVKWADFGTFVVVLASAVLFRPHTAPWTVGIAISLVSAPLWLVARYQLGSSFSLGARATRLCTRGLYSKIRHPIYLFGCLAELGALLALQYWWLLGLWLLAIPLEIWRARRERNVLSEAFGAEYDQYLRRTWF